MKGTTRSYKADAVRLPTVVAVGLGVEPAAYDGRGTAGPAWKEESLAGIAEVSVAPVHHYGAAAVLDAWSSAALPYQRRRQRAPQRAHRQGAAQVTDAHVRVAAFFVADGRDAGELQQAPVVAGVRQLHVGAMKPYQRSSHRQVLAHAATHGRARLRSLTGTNEKRLGSRKGWVTRARPQACAGACWRRSRHR